jgi:dTDP-glucose 4,6-dehydratase
MRYFVTGGAGFIGSNYVEHLLTNVANLTGLTIYDKFTYASTPKNFEKFLNDSRLTVIRGDICDLSFLEQSMVGHDFVVHFAAESHVDRSINNAENFVKTNILGTYNVLESAKLNLVKTVIHVSTDEVYGTIASGFSKEEDVLLPNSPYAASKSASDLLARSYHITHGLDVRITRSCNNYGAKQYPEKVIPVFVKKLLAGKKVPVYGDGKNIREWIHVTDHCQAIMRVLEFGESGEIYNIGSGVRMNNLELGNKIKSIMNIDSDIFEYVEDRPGHDLRYAVDVSKIKELGFTPTVQIERGLSSTISWYTDNPDWWTVGS